MTKLSVFKRKIGFFSLIKNFLKLRKTFFAKDNALNCNFFYHLIWRAKQLFTGINVLMKVFFFLLIFIFDLYRFTGVELNIKIFLLTLGSFSK